MKNKKPLISIIILNYNAGDLILNCINSVVQTKYENYEIILVDNVSIDNSHKKCKEKFEKIQLIENSKNFGFCEGNNIGVRNARGEFIIIINPDTTVTPNWIDKFLNAQKENGDGIYQPKIISLEDKKTILSTGNMIHLFGFGFARDKGNKYTDHLEKVETGLLTHSQAIKQIQDSNENWGLLGFDNITDVIDFVTDIKVKYSC